MRTIKTTTFFLLLLGLLTGAAVGVAAQDEEPAAEVASFTGVFSPDGEPLPVQSRSVDLPNGFTHARPGFAWSNRLESTDPRLTGDHRVVANWIIDPAGLEGPWSRGEEANMILSTVHELTNDGGSWLGEGTSFSSTELDLATGEIITFVGRDGYEGLTAYVLIDGSQEPATVSGVIFPTAMPETPEPYVTE